MPVGLRVGITVVPAPAVTPIHLKEGHRAHGRKAYSTPARRSSVPRVRVHRVCSSPHSRAYSQHRADRPPLQLFHTPLQRRSSYASRRGPTPFYPPPRLFVEPFLKGSFSRAGQHAREAPMPSGAAFFLCPTRGLRGMSCVRMGVVSVRKTP